MLWDMLKSHIGHQVRIVAYGDTDDPMDICLSEIASEMAAGEYDVCSRETLLSYAISEIENDRLFLARHILDAVDSGEYADFYFYDITMGTLDTPLAIESIGDLVDHIAE